MHLSHVPLLPLLQEEAGDPSKKRDWRCTDAPLVPQWAPKGAYPPPPPLGVDKPQAVAANKPGSGPKPLDRRLADLKAYRRAHGLCDHCGEKWSRDHKCAAQVDLHVPEELYALFSTEDTADSPATEKDEEQSCQCLFRGQIQQLPILILLDSGSSTSFISQELVTRLSVLPVQCNPFFVRVANGQTMQCVSLLRGAVWTIGNYQFQHDLKILPLGHYDIILGMDWLQLFSPMKVDWRRRWFAIPYSGTTVLLQGISPDVTNSPDELLVPSDNKAMKQKLPPLNDFLVSCHAQDSKSLFFP
jgi:hypothetical protein